MLIARIFLIVSAVLPLAACDVPTSAPRASASAAIAEVQSRSVTVSGYPTSGTTYLNFDLAHGFQVTYLENGQSWLWYPGNAAALGGRYEQRVVGGQNAMCWQYGGNTQNPVTGTSGGAFQCQSMIMSQKGNVAKLTGDVFNLKSGSVPYRLQRCAAPAEFSFDRDRFKC